MLAVKTLPIHNFLPEIKNLLSNHASVVLQAEPGAGKSTAVPLSLLNASFLQGKKIIMLEPRRVAAKSIALYLSSLLAEDVGQRVGYQIRNERKISKNTQLEIVTEGVLTRRLQHDPELSDIGLIIFDEFHERSLHADLALLLALEAQAAYRTDLTLLVMSATIDTEKVSQYLTAQSSSKAPILKCPGRTFPVSIEYLGKATTPLSSQIIKALHLALNRESQGDILVFLPGQADINRCIRLAEQQGYKNIEFLALYGGLSLAQQTLVLGDNQRTSRRVIFSTNIAETSLTIEGVVSVIDSGLEKKLCFDVKSGLSKLVTANISKASATQRSGRAGRLQSGHCLRLWSESVQQSLDDFQPEEITQVDLSHLVLELAAWGVSSYQAVNWLTAPPQVNFDVACELNVTLGLLDDKHHITSKGRKALTLGLAPRLAAMLLSAETDLEKSMSCILAALITERDIIRNASSADISERVLIFIDYLCDSKAFKGRQHVNIAALQQAVFLAKNFAKNIKHNLYDTTFSLLDLHAYLGPLLLTAYPDRLAQQNSQSSHRYLLANGRGVSLRETDAMIGEPWLVVGECDGQNKDGLIYLSASITLAQIRRVLKNQCNKRCHYFLDKTKEKIIGREKLTYQALVIEERLLSVIPQQEFELCVKDILMAEGLRFLHWTEKCEAWFLRVVWLGENVEDFPDISMQKLLADIDIWLVPYLGKVKSVKQLRQLNIYDLLIANLTWPQQQFLAQHAPEYYLTPSDKKIPIRYAKHQPPTVAVILQEMFGQLVSPLLAQGKVPLRFELLSPARRPIQTTSDLERFWQSSYFAVAKEMRGKYPRHRWPEKPLAEKPGKSIKFK